MGQCKHTAQCTSILVLWAIIIIQTSQGVSVLRTPIQQVPLNTSRVFDRGQRMANPRWFLNKAGALRNHSSVEVDGRVLSSKDGQRQISAVCDTDLATLNVGLTVLQLWAWQSKSCSKDGRLGSLSNAHTTIYVTAKLMSS